MFKKIFITLIFKLFQIDYLHLLPSFQDLNLGYFPNFTHFERKSDISLLFNKLLSSFCEILNEKVLPDSPQKKNLSDLAVHPMQVPFDQNMNNSSSHNYFNTLPGNTTNYNTALYPPRRFSHEYIQNFPYYDSGKYDLYQQQLETKRSVGMPQSIPEPPYIYPYGNMLDVSHPFIVDDRVVLNGTAIPNVVWANDIPHYSIYDTPIIEREFHRNDFGKHPTVTAMTPLLNNNVQINNTDDRIPRFNEISEDHNIDSQFECQNKIDYHLINELCARNEISDDFKRNSIIEKKLKSNHGYSNDIGSGSVKNNYLKLVDIMSMFLFIV